MYITEKKKEQQLYILPGKDVDGSKLQLKNQMEDWGYHATWFKGQI